MGSKHEDDRGGAQDIEPENAILFGGNHREPLFPMSRVDVKTLFAIRLA
jgi:hypothetical protein